MTLSQARNLTKSILFENGIQDPIDAIIDTFINNAVADIAINVKGHYTYMVDLVGSNYNDANTKLPTLPSQVPYPINADILEFDLENYVSNSSNESTYPLQSITPPTFEMKHHVSSIDIIFKNDYRLRRRTESQAMYEQTIEVYSIPRYGVIRFDPKIGTSDKIRIKYNYIPFDVVNDSDILDIPVIGEISVPYYSVGHYISSILNKKNNKFFSLYKYERDKMNNISLSSDSMFIQPYDNLRGV